MVAGPGSEQPDYDVDLDVYLHPICERYRRHLVAIFRAKCRCAKKWCALCWLAGCELYTIPRPAPCRWHKDTCQSCVAEYALYVQGDHPKAAGSIY